MGQSQEDKQVQTQLEKSPVCSVYWGTGGVTEGVRVMRQHETGVQVDEGNGRRRLEATARLHWCVV